MVLVRAFPVRLPPLAYLYAARQPQVYGKATTILIKDDYPKESVAATVLASTNGIVNTAATNLDNEIFLLSSHSLLETVVRKLKLDVTYWKKDKFRKVEIYQDSPIAVQFTQEGEAADARFRVVPLSETESRLEKDEKDRQGQETEPSARKCASTPDVHRGENASVQ